MPLAKTDNPFLKLVRPGAFSAEARFEIRVTAGKLEARLAKGHHVTDETFLEAIGWSDPPLLDQPLLAFIAKELEPSDNRGGRPRTRRPNLSDAIAAIEASPRDDLPPRFRKALVDRLRTRNCLTRSQLLLHNGKHFRKLDRHTLMRGLYLMIREQLSPGCRTLELEHFGPIEVPQEKMSPSRRAMMMVQQVMRDRLGMNPPSIERMMNVVAQKPPSFYVIEQL